ncbi:MAG: hypothetical protein PHF17_08450 [Arcobacteraceae bacterium]|nr:hypothetical protein [Arcobacteraceae bacterium]
MDEQIKEIDDLGIEYSIINKNDFYEKYYPLKSYNFWESVETDINYIQHRTSLKSTLNIIKTKQMFGNDTNKAAHFEIPTGSYNMPCENGITLYFKWAGKQMLACDDKKYMEKDILYHLSGNCPALSKKHQGYWESRIYPGTKSGLYLFAFKIEEINNIILFHNHIELEIVTKQELQQSVT